MLFELLCIKYGLINKTMNHLILTNAGHLFDFKFLLLIVLLGESKFVLTNLTWFGFLAFFTILLIFGKV